MTFWRVLREQPAALACTVALTPHARAEFDSCDDVDGCDDLEVARRVHVQLTQGRAAVGAAGVSQRDRAVRAGPAVQPHRGGVVQPGAASAAADAVRRCRARAMTGTGPQMPSGSGTTGGGRTGGDREPTLAGPRGEGLAATPGHLCSRPPRYPKDPSTEAVPTTISAAPAAAHLAGHTPRARAGRPAGARQHARRERRSG